MAFDLVQSIPHDESEEHKLFVGYEETIGTTLAHKPSIYNAYSIPELIAFLVDRQPLIVVNGLALSGGTLHLLHLPARENICIFESVPVHLHSPENRQTSCPNVI